MCRRLVGIGLFECGAFLGEVRATGKILLAIKKDVAIDECCINS